MKYVSLNVYQQKALYKFINYG